jgi:hypothetical protein
VGVGAGPCVVGQIPAGMVGVFVNDYGVTVPKPIRGVIVIVGRYAEVPIIEPEAIATSSTEAVLMATAKATWETTVFPRMILMIAGIVAARIVADPSVVVMDVRNFGVVGAITERAAIILRMCFLGARFLGMSFLGMCLLWTCFLRPCLLRTTLRSAIF